MITEEVLYASFYRGYTAQGTKAVRPFIGVVLIKRLIVKHVLSIL